MRGPTDGGHALGPDLRMPAKSGFSRTMAPAALEKRRIALQHLLHAAVRAARAGEFEPTAEARTLEFLEVPEFVWG